MFSVLQYQRVTDRENCYINMRVSVLTRVKNRLSHGYLLEIEELT